ncbi:4a-hydroxytetrahydrobiopterin dehydratase [Candidatus Woesearchaeota archaeon]|nr:4a-hydroxytetrahydrobiopterin dehydratase [Candidatus Woesearchaeota archaeon]
MNLSKKDCVPCKGGIPPLTRKQYKPLLKQVKKWTVVREHHIEKEYKFDDFAKALLFVNKTGKLAEQQGHHPDIVLKWGYVKLTLWTHKVDGLTERDFILAAKIDKLL